MIDTLAGLQLLRQHLREAIAKLEHAQGKPATFDAAAIGKVVASCRRLERIIERLSKDVLATEPPSNVA